MRRFVTCCAVLLALSGWKATLARAEIKWRTIGDWTIIENAVQISQELKDQEIPHVAATDALDGRRGILGVSGCGRFSVVFSFEADATFNAIKLEATDQMDNAKIAYTKILPDEGNLWPVVLFGGYVDIFLFDADAMARGSKFLMCPTREESAHCLTFSLKGITAALKAICPKR